MQRTPSAVVVRVNGVEEVIGDVRNRDDVRGACSQMDAVVHLAARVAVTGPWQEFYEVNVAGTRHVMEEARAAGVTRIVHVSSPSVAHAGHALIGADATPADANSARGHYSRSKAMAEIRALESDAPDFAVVVVRPHLVWGPGDTQLVARIVERARQGRLFVVAHGSALVDTTYVDNAADAIAAALEHASDAAVHGRAFVVSNAEPRPVRELFERMATAAGYARTIRSVPFPLAWVAGVVSERIWANRPTEPPITTFLAEQLATAHWFDQRETRAALNWAPKVSLAEGFERLRRSFL
jgi:nucleoside-diphosphate-sugar epimerase